MTDGQSPVNIKGCLDRIRQKEKNALIRQSKPARGRRAGLMLALLVMTALLGKTCGQTVHFVAQGQSTLTDSERVASVRGSLKGSSEFQFAVSFQNNASITNVGLPFDYSVKFYLPTYQNSSVTGSTEFTAYFTNERTYYPEHVVAQNSKNNKPFWISKDGAGEKFANSLSISGGTFTLETPTQITPKPVGEILAVADIEGSDKVAAIFTGTVALKNSLYLIDVSGSTPVVGTAIPLNDAKLDRLKYGYSFYISNPVANLYKMYLSGATEFTSLAHGLYIYDVDTAGNTADLKAAWKQSDYINLFPIADNLNSQDYIYTMLLDSATLDLANWSSIQYYLGVISVSELEALQATTPTTALTSNLFVTNPTVGKKVLAGNNIYKLLNLGTINYLLGVPLTASATMMIWNKDFATFATDSKSVYLPQGSPKTSATYAYGFFRYTGTGPFNLYYQGDLDNKGPLLKAKAVYCQSTTVYYLNLNTGLCAAPYAPSQLPSGYRQDDVRQEIELCSVASCDTCPASAATCTKCKAGFTLVGNACVECNMKNCVACSSPNVCATCASPYSGSQCDSILCTVKDCLTCSDANVCSACTFGKVPSADRRQCLVSADACKPSIPQCQTCVDGAVCSTCNQDYHLSGDATACLPAGCTIDHCTACDSNNLCTSCMIGFKLSGDRTTCQFVEIMPTEQTYSDFNSEDQQAYLQLTRNAADFDLSAFRYVLLDQITGETYYCRYCEAQLVPDYYKAMKFIVVSDVELLSATLQASYPLSSVKSSSRLLQGSDGYGAFRIENIRLPGGNGTKNNDKMAYQAFTTINALRFFGTIFLGLFNSAHAFWSTYQFSWIQLWALLPGKFVSYPDRFLNWHYKWYLLVIDFGDPFKSWKDWNTGGTKCFAQNEYPTSRLGCGFVDNFGQNFIIIFCVLAFCLLVSSIMVIDWWRKRKTGSPTSQPGTRRFFRSTTQIEKSMPKLLATVYIGLGMPYFFRFMDAIQPSLIYFSMLQFATYVHTPNIGASVFFAVCFFLYYLCTTAASFFLARKLWIAFRDTEEDAQDLGRAARRVGGWFRVFSFHYNGYTKVDAFWKLLSPIVEYVRVLLICIFMIALRRSPKASLGLVLVVEILHIAYIAFLHKYRVSFLYALQDYVITGFFFLYLILKIATNDAYSEKTIQMGVGWAMAFFLGIIWGFILLDLIIDTFIVVRSFFTNKKSTPKEVDDHEANVIDLISGNRNPGEDSPENRGKQPLSSVRRANYDDDEMAENPVFRPEHQPLKSDRQANYRPGDMSERKPQAQEQPPGTMVTNRRANYREDEIDEAPVQKQEQPPGTMVTNRRANYRDDEMDEAPQAVKVYVEPAHPLTTGRKANYKEEDMDEGQNRHYIGNYYNQNEEVFETNQVDVRLEQDGFFSLGMDEKKGKKDSSRILGDNGPQEHHSLTSPVSDNKHVTRGLVTQQQVDRREHNSDHRDVDTRPPVSDHYRGDAYDSREMNE